MDMGKDSIVLEQKLVTGPMETPREYAGSEELRPDIPSSEIGQRVQAIAGRLNVLDEALQTLATRLQPVLLPTDQPRVIEQAPRDMRSPLRAELDTCADFTSVLIDMVRGITERLEI